MKKTIYLFLFSLLSISTSVAQCDFPNPNFEEWTSHPVVLPDGAGGEAEGMAITPDGTTPFLRFLFLSFAGLGDPSIGEALMTDPQGVIGIDQSTDASSGDYSVKLQAGYGIDFSDIYSVTQCTEVPETFSIDIKHVGNTNDTISVALIIDKGLNGVPEDDDDLENFPAYVFESFSYNSDSAWSTISLPVIQNFEEDIDTAYYLIIAETSGDSYFLIDNIKINDTVDPPVESPTVIINEVQSENDYVELYNYGTEAVDVSDMYIINDGNAETIGGNFILCPFQSTVIDPDDYLVVKINNINNNSGEIILSTSSAVDSGDEFFSYVSWGQSQALEGLAVEAGLWTAGEYAPQYFELGSLEYDGEGKSGSDWVIAGVNSLCDMNFTGCDLQPATIEFSSDDEVLCLCTEDIEYISVNYSSGGSQYILGIITNDQGEIIGISEDDDNFSEFDSVCSDEELTYYALSYDNTISGVLVGNNISDIIGCYAFSNPLSLTTSNLQPFELEINVDGSPVEGESLAICLMDDIIEEVSFSTNTTEGELVYFVLNQNDEVVLQIESESSTFTGLEPGEYTVGAFNYEGLLFNSVGLTYANINGCYTQSENSFELTILGEQDGCTTATEDISLINISLTSNLISNTLEVNNPENRGFTYQIFSTSGSNYANGSSSSITSTIDVTSLPSGIYFMSIQVDNQQYRTRFIKQ